MHAYSREGSAQQEAHKAAAAQMGVVLAPSAEELFKAGPSEYVAVVNVAIVSAVIVSAAKVSISTTVVSTAILSKALQGGLRRRRL